MASLFDRVAKRTAYPVRIGDGVIHVCEPTYALIDRVKAMKPSDNGEDLRTGLTLALCVVNEDGSQAFPANDGETDEQLAKRVSNEAKVLTPSAIRQISDAITRLLNPVNGDELTKN